MAQDSTGTPTSKGIPKFNTAVDPPTGKGTNAMMDAIDTILSGYAALTAGKLPLGTLAQGGATLGQAMIWNGSAWAPDDVSSGGPSYGTTLPASPADGEEAILVDSTTSPTYTWRFRYNAGSAHTDKWEFIGGAPVSKETSSSRAINGGTQVAASGYYYSAGGSFTVPRAGVYRIQGSGFGTDSTNGNGPIAVAVFSGTGLGQSRQDTTAPPAKQEVSVIGTMTAAASAVVGIAWASIDGLPGNKTLYQEAVMVTPVRVS